MTVEQNIQRGCFRREATVNRAPPTWSAWCSHWIRQKEDNIILVGPSALSGARHTPWICLSAISSYIGILWAGSAEVVAFLETDMRVWPLTSSSSPAPSLSFYQWLRWMPLGRVAATLRSASSCHSYSGFSQSGRGEDSSANVILRYEDKPSCSSIE